jgi:hypothetical protein
MAVRRPVDGQLGDYCPGRERRPTQAQRYGPTECKCFGTVQPPTWSGSS